MKRIANEDICICKVAFFGIADEIIKLLKSKKKIDCIFQAEDNDFNAVSNQERIIIGMDDNISGVDLEWMARNPSSPGLIIIKSSTNDFEKIAERISVSLNEDDIIGKITVLVDCDNLQQYTPIEYLAHRLHSC